MAAAALASPTKIQVPFVVGRNAGKSHSLPVNLQRMLSLVKSHAPQLCAHCHGTDAMTPGTRKHAHPSSPSGMPHVHGDFTPPRPSAAATIAAHAAPAAIALRARLEDQLHRLHVELARLVRASDSARDAKAKREMHPKIQSAIRKMAALEAELDAQHHGHGGDGDDGAAAASPQRRGTSSGAATHTAAAAAAAASIRSASAAAPTRRPTTERPIARNLSLLRSSQRVQMALASGS
ncbi:hypothetical protein BC828DRAFT_387743 [Blastocladiella britannica]|nr:hypothetical protein BC828DRAFT_387743 [Blastocladiella britannica]